MRCPNESVSAQSVGGSYRRIARIGIVLEARLSWLSPSFSIGHTSRVDRRSGVWNCAQALSRFTQLARVLLRVPVLSSWHRRLGDRFRRDSRARAVWFVTTRSLLVMAGLELAYLIAANGVLQTGLVRKAVESAQGLKLTHGTAYSVVPGRILVRDLRLRFEDYNVQFQLTVARAELDLSLHEMLFRKFHVLSVRADNVTLLLRHKVESVEQNEARLAAFPRIEGYADPPLYRGEAPGAISDQAASELWEVHVENILAHATELWMLEYRFEGRAEARGAFLLRPTRWVEVKPGTLHITSGSLTAGAHRVAESLGGSISCSVPGFDVRSAPGMQVFGHVSARADLQLSGGTLDFMNLYTSPQLGVSLTGPLLAEAHIRLQRGLLMPGTVVRAHADTSHVNFGPIELAGQLDATLARDDRQERLNFRLEALHSTLQNREPGSVAQAPVLQQALAEIAVSEANVVGPLAMADASMSLRGTVPDLAWLEGLTGKGSPRFRGAGDLSLVFRRNPQGAGEGRVALEVRDAGVLTETGRVRLTGKGVALFQTTEQPRRYAQGALSVNLAGADSLLSVAIDPALRSIAIGVLDLGTLEANVAFHLSRSLVQFELTRARSGNVDARGQLRSAGLGPPRGALLVSSGVLRVGLTVEPDGVDVSPLVGPKWLEDTLRSMGQSVSGSR